jgi:protein O-mannosyl-transferase
MAAAKTSPMSSLDPQLEGPGRLPRSAAMLLAGLALLAVAAAHYPVLAARALSIDDRQYLVDNHLIQNPSWHSVGRFFAEIRRPSTVEGYYQPLSMVSLMLDYAAGGRIDNPQPFHRTSLTLHVVNVALLMMLLASLTGRTMPAIAAGLLYGLHPLTVEPLPWIGERKTLLATAFALASLITYVRYARRTNRRVYALVTLLYLLGLLCKPTILPLPVLMLLLDFWPLDRLNRRAVLEKAPLLMLGLAAGIVAVGTQGSQTSTPYPAGTIILVAGYDIPFYLSKILLPAGLTSVYPFPEPLRLANPMIIGACVLTLLLAAAICVSLRWTRALFVGAGFFLLAICPTFTNVGYSLGIAADKYAYFPLAGMALIAAWGLSRLWSIANGAAARTKRTAVVCIVAGLAVGFAALTRHQYRFWRNTETLFQRIVDRAPDSPTGYAGLAYALAEQKRVDEVITLLEPVVGRHPEWYNVQLNLGKALLVKNRPEEAILHFRQALVSNPAFVPARYELGMACLALNRHDEGLRELGEVVRQKPQHLAARLAMAREFARTGQLDLALQEARAVVTLQPAHLAARRLVAEVLVRRQQYADAAGELATIVESDPQSPSAHHNLANALAMTGRPAEAELHYREAIRLASGYAAAWASLGELLATTGRTREAIEIYRRVLQLDPDRQDVRDELRRLETGNRPASRPAR